MTDSDSNNEDSMEDAPSEKLGVTLQRAREQKGLQIEDVAHRLNLNPQRIYDMENDDYRFSGAETYAKGYLRSYAKFLGLDPDLIIRDFDREHFNTRKENVAAITKQMQEKYGAENIILEMNDQYYNMQEKIEPVKEIVDVAYEAMKNLDIEPNIQPIRGGTDGSQLSYMGLPTPNIFTGEENYHGKFEYVSVDNMEKAVQVIIEIARLFEEKA